MIIHLNGQLTPAEHARISPLDRGFILGEGVYEGLRAIPWPSAPHGVRIVGLTEHTERMRAGLSRACIDADVSQLGAWSAELCKANGLTDAFVYWQVTGGPPALGEPPRVRVPGRAGTPTVFGYASPQPAFESLREPPVKRVRRVRDVRWEVGTLKSTSLLGNVLCAREAAAHGCDEALLIRGFDPATGAGVLAEGLATNVAIVVDRGGHTEIATPSLSSAPILAGVTRTLMLRVAPEIVERTVDARELASAREVMFFGTTTFVTSVVEIDGRTVGDGRPGPATRDLFARLMRFIREGRDLAQADRPA